MSGTEHTVINLKFSFLRSQIRILSQPLQPAQRWRDGARPNSVITDRAIEDAVREMNRQVRRHTKAAYPTLAVRHVAEQIDRLYWDAGEPDQDADDFEDPDDGIIRLGDDFSDGKTIEKLPDAWEDEGASASASARQRVYEETLQKLTALQGQKAEVLKKLAAARELQATLKPFSEAQTNVQANLVTRDGKLALELDRCQELSIRVCARIGSFRETQSLLRVDSGTAWASADASAMRLENAWNAA